MAHPSDSLSYLPLVVRELGLRAAEAYDLASEVPVDDVHLGPVAYFLVLADLILPIVCAAEPPLTARSTLTASVGGIAAFAPVVAGACEWSPTCRRR